MIYGDISGCRLMNGSRERERWANSMLRPIRGPSVRAPCCPTGCSGSNEKVFPRSHRLLSLGLCGRFFMPGGFILRKALRHLKVGLCYGTSDMPPPTRPNITIIVFN